MTTVEGECVSGDVQLSGGINTESSGNNMDSLVLEGRLDVCLNNAWGAVCDSLFGDEELQVICSQLAGVIYDGEC